MPIKKKRKNAIKKKRFWYFKSLNKDSIIYFLKNKYLLGKVNSQVINEIHVSEHVNEIKKKYNRDKPICEFILKVYI